jgi:hypothetical protein
VHELVHLAQGVTQNPAVTLLVSWVTWHIGRRKNNIKMDFKDMLEFWMRFVWSGYRIIFSV